MSTPCEVESCTGKYITNVLYYIKLRSRNNKITIEEYKQLESKKGYIGVVDQRCNVCNDDLDKRLVSFIRENSHTFVNRD